MELRKSKPLALAVTLAYLILIGSPVGSSAQSDPTDVWTLQLPDYPATSSPAIAPDGTIYQATFTGALLAVTPEGKAKWTFKAGREIKSSPAIGDDGTIYFGSRDHKFYAISPQGRLKWTFQTGAWVDSSPALGADGTIYFGSWDTNFYALHPDGSLKWIFPTGGIVDSSPAIAGDGTIYFGSHDKKFYALKPDGTLRWSFATGGQIISSPALAAGGTVYFTSTDGNFYALHPDGTEHWRLHTGGATESSPVLDESGNIYLAVNQEKESINSDGKKRWTLGSPDLIDASPAVAANGLIYYSQPWHALTALWQDGSQAWTLDTELRVTAAPNIGSDGTLYIAEGEYLHAINSTNRLALLAKSSWPMFRANPYHTGRIEVEKSTGGKIAVRSHLVVGGGAPAGATNAGVIHNEGSLDHPDNSRVQFVRGAYMDWSHASNGSWPCKWISDSGNLFNIPTNQLGTVHNLAMVTDGAIGGQVGVNLTNYLGSNETQLVIACVNPQPFDVIGCDFYVDTYSGGNFTNWPGVLFTAVVSTNVMVADNVETIPAGRSFLHMHFWITGASAGNLAQIYPSIEFETNFPNVYTNYNINNLYITNPAPAAQMMKTLQNSTLHNLEFRRIQTDAIQEVLDGCIIMTVMDTNISNYWGNGTAWWEYGTGGAPGQPTASDTMRIRFRDCYTGSYSRSAIGRLP
jgi:outer membrane protein assembly factor BamB